MKAQARSGPAIAPSGSRGARKAPSRRRRRGRRAPPDVVEALFGHEGLGSRERRAVILAEGLSRRQEAPARSAALELAEAAGTPFASALLEGRLVVAVGVPPPARAPSRTGKTEGPRRWLRRVALAIQRGAASRGAAPWVATGGPAAGPAGIRTSYREAEEALRLARLLKAEPSVVAFDEVVCYKAVADDPQLAARLAAILAPLAAHDRTGPQRLLEILEAYLDAGTLEGAARRLKLHRHTASRWLALAEQLLERSLTNREDRLTLEMALRARRILGLPPQGRM